MKSSGARQDVRPISSIQQIFFRNDAPTLLGRLTMAGLDKDTTGLLPNPLRIFGRYAVVYTLCGIGQYRDANGYSHRLRAGDLLLVFPELAHTYHAHIEDQWSSLYLVFDGPVFDFWRQAGLLDSERPVHHLEPVADWLRKLMAIIEAPRPVTVAERTLEVSRFLDLLTEMVVTSSSEMRGATQMPQLLEACRILESGLDQPIDMQGVARETGMSYENFRKQFHKYMGVSPMRYRTIRRIDAACAMLQHSDATISTIAGNLNFSDEAHFYKRFKQITSMTPRQFRLRRTSRS